MSSHVPWGWGPSPDGEHGHTHAHVWEEARVRGRGQTQERSSWHPWLLVTEASKADRGGRCPPNVLVPGGADPRGPTVSSSPGAQALMGCPCPGLPAEPQSRQAVMADPR